MFCDYILKVEFIERMNSVMKYGKRIICAAVAAGMLFSFAGCKDKNNKNNVNSSVNSPDQPTQNMSAVATGDVPSGASYKIGNVKFSQSDTELQLGDVTFTDEDLEFISTCTNLEYFCVLSQN